MGITREQMINRTSEKWFLDKGISYWAVGKNHLGKIYLDLNLTDYKIHRVYEQSVRNKLSELRYITIKDCLIKPGFGKGTLTINDRNFKVTYAWAGLSSKRYHNRRLSYTVRIEPLGEFNLGKFVSNLTKIIYFNENILYFRKSVKRVNTFTFEESGYLKRKYMKD